MRAALALFRAAAAAAAVAAGLKIHGPVIFPVVIGYRALYGFLGENGTVQLCRREAVKRFRNG